MEGTTLNELASRLENIEAIVLELLQTVQKGALSVEEAAEYIGISYCSLYKLMDTDPSFPEFRPVGMKRRIIPRESLDKWLAENAKTRRNNLR